MKNKYWLLGIHRLILADQHSTDGHYDLVEGTAENGAKTPYHVHTKYSETIYILAGELTVYTKGKIHVLKPGEHISIQKGTPHSLLVSGRDTTKTLTMFSPSGFADVIRATGIPGKAHTPPLDQKVDMAHFIQLSTQIGDITLGLDDIHP